VPVCHCHQCSHTEVPLTCGAAKNTWQDYKTNEDILSELKINPAVHKIQQ
jgi:hypothetical protein